MTKKIIKQLAVAAQFAVLIAVSAQITYPLGAIPLTGQTLAVGFTATVAGGWLAATAVGIYLVCGLVGLPVFANMGAGPFVLFGPYGGYLLAFLVTALFVGKWLEQTAFSLKWALVANLLGALLTLTIGTVWLAFSTGLAVSDAFTIGLLPFLIPDAVKAVGAAVLGINTRRLLIKSHFLS